MARELHGRRVVLTGASSGLGRALALELASEGARLILVARCRDALAAVVTECRERGAEAHAIPADVTVDGDCAGIVEQAVAHYAGIDVLVTAAGLGMWARLADLDDTRVLREVMEADYWGTVLPLFHALPQLRATGGLLIAISSIQGRVGVPWHSGYAAAKHAVQGFCNSLRLEEPDIDVLTVLPHWIRGTEHRARALGADGRPRAAAAAAHRADAISAQAAAGRIVVAARRRRRTLWIPARMRLLGLLAEIAPTVADSLIRRRVEREQRP